MSTAWGSRSLVRVGGASLVALALSVACTLEDEPKPSGSGGEAGSAGAGSENGGSDSGGQSNGDDGGSSPMNQGGTTGTAGTESVGGGGAGEPGTVVGGAGAGGAGGSGDPGPELLFDCTAATGAQQSLKLTEVSKALSLPMAVAQPLGETERLFVAELSGAIRILKGTQLAPEPFLALGGIIDFSDPERGLVALAFHPRYVDNGRFFVVYTTAPSNGGTLQLSEFQRADADHAAPTEKPLLTVAQPKPNHVGRALAFGPDGNLYWALGDGGGSSDESLVGQLATGLLGKIARIDVDAAPAASKAYAIPAGNMAGGAPERWAFGLRFPLGLSFDACTGDMFVADSQSPAFEEINFAPAKQGGQNYGWSMYAGNECFKPACTAAGKTFPAYVNDDAFMLHGGFVYRGSKLPSFRGHYFAVDRSSQVAVAFELVNGAPVLRNLSADLGVNLVGTQGIGQDSHGELYLANHSGAVYRIDPE